MKNIMIVLLAPTLSFSINSFATTLNLTASSTVTQGAGSQYANVEEQNPYSIPETVGSLQISSTPSRGDFDIQSGYQWVPVQMAINNGGGSFGFYTCWNGAGQSLYLEPRILKTQPNVTIIFNAMDSSRALNCTCIGAACAYH